MRKISTLLLSCAAALPLFFAASAAQAGVVSAENALTDGVTGDFLAGNDGTAETSAGVVDVYPDQWSVTAGTTVNLKIRSVGSGYTVQIFRVGWYGGSGAREVTPATGMSGAADPQPYPTPDGKYGLAAAGWHNSIAVNTTGFTPGVYVARVNQTGGAGYQGDTFFVVRDDTLAAKQPILFVLAFNTHEAYNAWPGMDRGGKSLYAWNSSAATVSETNADVRKGQAVKVSFDRPFLVGGGTADIFRWEYPMIRWLEKNGYEVAYALDRDLDVTPSVWSGRNAAVYAGHQEYWSGQMFTNALSARDAGVNMLFVSGDTISWQVRFEDAYKTLVGYKENWPNDPMQKIDPNAVTRGFKTLPTPRPAIQLTGVMSSGQIKDASGAGKDFPWADWIVSNTTGPMAWLWAGTTVTSGYTIKNVMGYEVDSCSIGSTEFDAYRPPGQTRIGTIIQSWDGVAKGSPCFYQKAIGGGKNVEVVGIGSMAFTWALDDYAEKQGYSTMPSTVDPNAQRMTKNILDRWLGGSPPVFTPPDAGPTDADPTPVPPDEDGGVPPDATIGDATVTDGTVATDSATPQTDGSVATDSATPPGQDGSTQPTGDSGGEDTGSATGVTSDTGSSSCSCTTAGGGSPSTAGAALVGLAVAIALGRRKKS